MPKYSFECQYCNVQFSRTLKMGEHEDYPCPSCETPAPRLWQGFGFGFAEGSGAPGNTGVAKHDYPTADQAVGSSADKRWQEIRAREEVKDKVREKSGDRALIRRNGQGYVEYEGGTKTLIDIRKDLVRRANSILSKNSGE